MPNGWLASHWRATHWSPLAQLPDGSLLLQTQKCMIGARRRLRGRRGLGRRRGRGGARKRGEQARRSHKGSESIRRGCSLAAQSRQLSFRPSRRRAPDAAANDLESHHCWPCANLRLSARYYPPPRPRRESLNHRARAHLEARTLTTDLGAFQTISGRA